MTGKQVAGGESLILYRARNATCAAYYWHGSGPKSRTQSKDGREIDSFEPDPRDGPDSGFTSISVGVGPTSILSACWAVSRLELGAAFQLGEGVVPAVVNWIRNTLEIEHL